MLPPVCFGIHQGRYTIQNRHAFFLDNRKISKRSTKANALGILDGVTPTPSLISKEGKPFKETTLHLQ